MPRHWFCQGDGVPGGGGRDRGPLFCLRRVLGLRKIFETLWVVVGAVGSMMKENTVLVLFATMCRDITSRQHLQRSCLSSNDKDIK